MILSFSEERRILDWNEELCYPWFVGESRNGGRLLDDVDNVDNQRMRSSMLKDFKSGFDPKTCSGQMQVTSHINYRRKAEKSPIRGSWM